MRRTILMTLLMTLFFSLSAGPVQGAADAPKIILDGVPTVLLPEPFEQNGDFMVPLRIMAEALGAEISWDAENQAILGSRQASSFALRVDSQQAWCNGHQVTLPRPVQVINYQSYVPWSFMGDALEIKWVRDGATLRIYDRADKNQAAYFILADIPALGFTALPEAGQGEYLSMYLDDIEPGDLVTLHTNLDHGADFYPGGTGKIVLLPVACTQTPGLYYLQIQAQREGHTYLWAQEIVQVLPRSFPAQYLPVSSQTAAQRGPDLWALDEPFWEHGLAYSADQPLWMGTFIQPASGRISTEFGSMRTVNQEAPTRHSGLDIAVPAGTPVRASQAGVVSLAMPLNVTGNTIFVDHGCQLFSLYYHLNRIFVTEGQTVKAGDLIGEVGSTGFSTGPHLHWSMYLNGVYVNPALFTNPATAPLYAP